MKIEFSYVKKKVDENYKIGFTIIPEDGENWGDAEVLFDDMEEEYPHFNIKHYESWVSATERDHATMEIEVQIRWGVVNYIDIEMINFYLDIIKDQWRCTKEWIKLEAEELAENMRDAEEQRWLDEQSDEFN